MSNLIMCVDVGLANVGLVIVDPKVVGPAALVYSNHFTTERIDAKLRWRYADDKARRVAEVAAFYHKVIKDYGINRCLAELPTGGAPNSQAATDLAYASSALVAVLEVNNVAREWYSPQEVKKALAGKPSASKREMMDAALLVFPQLGALFPRVGRLEHVADAVGVWMAGRRGNLVLMA